MCEGKDTFHVAMLVRACLVEACSKEGGLVRERTDEAALVASAEQAHGKAVAGGVGHVVRI